MRTCFVMCLCGVLLALSVPASACVGARALGMGGAFVGLADDVSATYWNPAALVDLDGPVATWMHTATNRESMNYQDYLAYATPIGDDAAAGLSYIGFKFAGSLGMYGSGVISEQAWGWLSMATRVGEDTALGANLKFIRDDDVRFWLYGYEVPVLKAETETAFDLSLYHHAGENVTLGLLVQNINEPELKVVTPIGSGPVAKWGRNYRPGVAVRVPEKDLILSAEVYNATGDDRALRFGMEKRFEEEQYALRAGWYGDADAPTLGAGTWQDGWSFDVAWMGGDVNGTLLASVTTEFQ